MKKIALIILSFILLAAGLSVLSACSIKSPSVKQTPQDITKENQATTTVENNVAGDSATSTIENILGITKYFCRHDYVWVVQEKGGIRVTDNSGHPFGGYFDSKTFDSLNCEYVKDANRVVFIDNKKGDVGGADSKTFTVIKYDYARDKNNIYNMGEVIPVADPKSFKIIDKAYSGDKKNVYFGVHDISGADPLTFKILAGLNSELEDGISVATDKNNVYCEGAVLIGADVKTFQIYDNKDAKPLGGYYKDKNNYYDSSCKKN